LNRGQFGNFSIVEIFKLQWWRVADEIGASTYSITIFFKNKSNSSFPYFSIAVGRLFERKIISLAAVSCWKL